MALSRIYSWQVFDSERKVWIHTRRAEMHGLGWWFSVARTQAGDVIASRPVSPDMAADLFSRYGSDAEITYLS